jgi:hypothetical protein
VARVWFSVTAGTMSGPSTTSMLAELSRYSLHLALGVRKHRAIVCRFHDFIG